MTAKITNENAAFYTVIGWRGTIFPLQKNAEQYRRLGYPGVELNLLGDLAQDSNIDCVYPVESTDNLKNMLDWFNNLKNTYIGVEISYLSGTISYQRVLVLSINTTIKVGRYAYKGKVYNKVIWIAMTLQDQSGYEITEPEPEPEP